MELTDRVALITGGRRIGAFLAKEFARKGAHITMVYRGARPEAAEALLIQADLQEPDACRRVVEQTVARFGRLDVLVNMASIYRQKTIDDLTLADLYASAMFHYFMMAPEAEGLIDPFDNLKTWWSRASCRPSMIKTKPT